MSDEAVCRTAPDTSGLFMSMGPYSEGKNELIWT